MEDAVQVNFQLDRKDAEQLDRLARELGYETRSPFIRKLIRQELARWEVEVALLRAGPHADLQIQS